MFLKIIDGLRHIYWRIFKPRTFGVKCLIQKDNKFLLILNSYGSGWNLPGGGIKRRENPDDAVIREVSEETGLKLSEVNLLGEYVSRSEGKLDTVYCYHSVVEDSTDVRIGSREILETKWFQYSDLPDDISYAVQYCLKLIERKSA